MLTLLTLLIGFAVPISVELYLWFPFILGYIVQMIVDASFLEIQTIKITKCDDTSFCLTMTSRISNTGPFPAQIAPMDGMLYSSKNGNPFACVKLPAIAARVEGSSVSVEGQRVKILDFEEFHNFNRNLVQQKELTVTMKGSTRLGLLDGLLSVPITIAKTSILSGFNGLNIYPLVTRKMSRSLLQGHVAEIEVDVSIPSASEVSIEMGKTHVQIRHDAMVIANLSADVMLAPGDNRITWRGKIDIGQMIKNPFKGIGFLRKDMDQKENVHAMVIGMGGDQCKWLDRTAKEVRSPIELQSTLRDIMASLKKEKTGEEKDGRPKSRKEDKKTMQNDNAFNTNTTVPPLPAAVSPGKQNDGTNTLLTPPITPDSSKIEEDKREEDIQELVALNEERRNSDERNKSMDKRRKWTLNSYNYKPGLALHLANDFGNKLENQRAYG